MKPFTFECPKCTETNIVYISTDETDHLQRCPDCRNWFVITDSQETTDAQWLGTPPTCPVADCEQELTGVTPPEHIIRVHDGSLNPESPPTHD